MSRDRHYVRRSAPIGRIDLRLQRRVRFGQRMKPKSWTTDGWFRSALFARGIPSRKIAFARLMQRTPA